MGVAPKGVASSEVNHSQKYVANWCLPVVIGNAVLVDVTVLDCASLPSRCDDVPTLIGVSGKHENKVRLLSVLKMTWVTAREALVGCPIMRHNWPIVMRAQA